MNDLGYAHRPRTEQPGEFTVGRDAMLLIPRAGDHQGQLVRLVFGGRPPKSTETTRIDTIELPATQQRTDRITLDAP